MRINRLSTKEYVARLEQWHPYFAWHFVELANGETRWLQTVERRLEGGKAKIDSDGLILIWEYRLKTK